MIFTKKTLLQKFGFSWLHCKILGHYSDPPVLSNIPQITLNRKRIFVQQHKHLFLFSSYFSIIVNLSWVFFCIRCLNFCMFLVQYTIIFVLWNKLYKGSIFYACLSDSEYITMYGVVLLALQTIISFTWSLVTYLAAMLFKENMQIHYVGK